jgi:HAD superfamily hydrolase (TIGR01509 family)
MPKIKAIIFDMDGVLIDAKEWHYDALNKALGLFGYQISRIDHLTTFDGLSTRQKLKVLTAEKNLPLGLHDFINELKQMYTHDLVHTNCKPVFAHEYALARLRNEQYRLAVASNSIRLTVELMMRKSGLADFMEFTLSNQDVVRAKPDPQIYRLAFEKLSLCPDECLIVEDNHHGVAAARESGAHVMVVSSPDNVNYYSISQHILHIEKNN